MKIGIIFSLYNCVDFFDQCVEPWFKLKEKYNFIFSVCSGVHQQMDDKAKQRAKYNNAYSLLKILGKNFDFIITTMGENNWTDEKSKTYLLNYLKDHDVDIVWVVDGDEIYTEDQIINIINFIETNPQYDIYSLRYKNYIFKNTLWVDDFVKRVIYWTDRNNGIKNFIFDTDVGYNNNTYAIDSKKSCEIKRNIAFINHYTWLVTDPRTKEKLNYQNNKYFGSKGKKCALKYDDDNGLVFNEDFYEDRNILLPTLHETISISSTSITSFLNRDSNEIWIQNHNLSGNHNISVLNSDNLLLYECVFDFEKNTNYFVKLFDIELKNLDKIRIIISNKENKCTIHDEYLHVKLYERFFFN